MKKVINIWRRIVLSKNSRKKIKFAEGTAKLVDFMPNQSNQTPPNRSLIDPNVYESFEAIKRSIFIPQNAEKFIYFSSRGELNKAAIWKDKKSGELKFSIVKKGPEYPIDGEENKSSSFKPE